MIKFDAKRKIFHLSNDNYSYYFSINKLGYLIHLYSGKKLNDITLERVNERYIERYAYLKQNLEICDVMKIIILVNKADFLNAEVI